ncbi:MAG: AAA family ATPase, partial [Ignavibacteriales bacterium]|nr:AAA family ATPase [Ignavibacteriales bacterium]
ITIIDFKDYSGKLEFSENNPWKLTDPAGTLQFVQGGNQNRNPFQQVKAYRFVLAEFLTANEQKIIEGVRQPVEWIHTGTIVLFHQDIIFDNDTLPQGIKRYFRVSDFEHIADELFNLNSKSLNLTDNEITRILQVFNVGADNLLEKFDIEMAPPPAHAGTGNLALIDSLTTDIPPSEFARMIMYYKTLIEIEKFHDVKSDNLFPVPFQINNESGIISFNIHDSPDLENTWISNLTQNFPKNLFIGIDFNIGGIIYPLLYSVLLYNDVDIDSNNEIYTDSILINTNILLTMGLSEDLIDEISSSVSEVSSLNEKIEKLSTFLELEITIAENLKVGLSAEGFYTAQLISELKKILQLIIGDDRLFTNFLFKRQIQPIEKINLEPLVQITRLNSSQKKAIEKTFQQPLTVITGPPGTGKSQVILNIIANAINNNLSVLFASKNNKAVDTVKERFDQILGDKYLIRFGNADEVNTKTRPHLHMILGKKAAGGFINDANSLAQLKFKNIRNYGRLNTIISQLEKLSRKKEEYTSLCEKLEKQKVEFSDWENNIDPEINTLMIVNGNRIIADQRALDYTLSEIIDWDANWLSRIFFNLFKREKLITKLQQLENEEEKVIKDFIYNRAPLIDPSKRFLVTARVFLENLRQLKKISEKKSEFEGGIRDSENRLQTLKDEISVEPELLIELDNAESDYVNSGINFIQRTIINKLSELDLTVLQSFYDSLPAKNIWMDGPVAEFIKTTKNFLKDFNAVCATNLSIKNGMPLSESLFDMLVIDEASQCDIASALPLILRAKRVVLIGDPLQLKQITKVKPFEEKYLITKMGLDNFTLNYCENSLFDFSFNVSNLSKLESVFLAEHYRSHSQIINFSNHEFYEKKLGQTILIKTKDSDFAFGEGGLIWINVKGIMDIHQNINPQENNRCIEQARMLREQYPDASIGIVTPFRHQYLAIRDRALFHGLHDVKVDTVHNYQGDEKDIMILSLVVTDNATPGKAYFINKESYLINVAVTRARSTLYIVGNYNYCRNLTNGNSDTPLSSLAKYAETEGRVIV